jgi:DNA topoisomerase-6 subunit B
MAKRQRDISISEFFTKNRHLLGFDNPTKALLTTVREAIDNALDACEEAGIIPDLVVRIDQLEAPGAQPQEAGALALAPPEPLEENGRKKTAGRGVRKDLAQEERFRVTVEDNGPGIVRAQVPKVFGKLLYGSKFHRLKQSRGQQGIGISAAGMYGQMTTGKPVVCISKTEPDKAAHRIVLHIDTGKNAPVIDEDKEARDTPCLWRPRTPEGGWGEPATWAQKEHGTSVSMDLVGAYKGGQHGVEAYLKQTALANPHASLTFHSPRGEVTHYQRVVSVLPPEGREIQPHPHGIELGTFLRMLKERKDQTARSFLMDEFSRVSDRVAVEVLQRAGVPPEARAHGLNSQLGEKVYRAVQEQKLMAPPTDCLSPIGEEALQKALLGLFADSSRDEDEEVPAEAEAPTPGPGAPGEAAPPPAAPRPAGPVVVRDEEKGEAVGLESGRLFVTATTRPPAVYRGNPFQVEVAIAWGGGLPADELARVFRFANRVPLLYQQSACAISKSVVMTPWRNYEVAQSRGALPTGPMVVMVHIASVWVPYTSESKEAIAHYPEILRELKLALMECGRKLAAHLRRKRRFMDEAKKKSYIEKYIAPIGEALQEILALSSEDRDQVVEVLKATLEHSRKMS